MHPEMIVHAARLEHRLNMENHHRRVQRGETTNPRRKIRKNRTT